MSLSPEIQLENSLKLYFSKIRPQILNFFKMMKVNANTLGFFFQPKIHSGVSKICVQNKFKYSS